jgi:hypothetical protein
MNEILKEVKPKVCGYFDFNSRIENSCKRILPNTVKSANIPVIATLTLENEEKNRKMEMKY